MFFAQGNNNIKEYNLSTPFLPSSKDAGVDKVISYNGYS